METIHLQKLTNIDSSFEKRCKVINTKMFIILESLKTRFPLIFQKKIKSKQIVNISRKQNLLALVMILSNIIKFEYLKPNKY